MLTEIRAIHLFLLPLLLVPLLLMGCQQELPNASYEGSFDTSVEIEIPELSDGPEVQVAFEEDVAFIREALPAYDGQGRRNLITHSARAHQSEFGVFENIFRDPDDPVVIDWVFGGAPVEPIRGGFFAFVNGRSVPLRCAPGSAEDGFLTWEEVLETASADACGIDQSSLEPLLMSVVLDESSFLPRGRQELTLMQLDFAEYGLEERSGWDKDASFNVFNGGSGEATLDLSLASTDVEVVEMELSYEEQTTEARGGLVAYPLNSERTGYLNYRGPTEVQWALFPKVAVFPEESFDEPFGLALFVDGELVHSEVYAPNGASSEGQRSPRVLLDVQLDPGQRTVHALVLHRVGSIVGRGGDVMRTNASATTTHTFSYEAVVSE